MDEIFSDNDVQRVFELVGKRGIAPRIDDLEDHDRELMNQFIRADQNPDKLATPAMLIDACVAGIRTFEGLSDPMPRSWAHGWKKFVLYITALNTQTLWDRFQRASSECRETAIFADWVVFSIGRNGWGPDGNSTPLGKQHSYCMSVAAEAGGGIQINPATGLAEAPDGSAARRYRQAVGPSPERATGPAWQEATEQNQPRRQSGERPAEDPASSSGSAWEAMKERARHAQQHVNPLALQHGIESVQGALTGAGIAKVDKNTGRIKIKKFGMAKAAVQPTRTLRRALDGAALTEHLKEYNESQSAMQPRPSSNPGEKLTTGNSYLNLLLDAGISDDNRDRYSRLLDAVLAEEGITAGEIVGVGEKGTGIKDLYVVHRQAITLASERGVLSKRAEVQRVCPVAPIARLSMTQQGFRPPELTITAYDAQGEVLSKIVWTDGFEDWEKRLVRRQREHLFQVISRAANKTDKAGARRSVSSAWSKAGALREWAAEVVRASGAEVTAERVEEHANMIAGGIRFLVFMDMCGIDDLGKFYPDGAGPSGTPIATFDDLYGRVVARVGGAQPVDQGIDELLDRSWDEFVRGCRERYC